MVGKLTRTSSIGQLLIFFLGIALAFVAVSAAAPATAWADEISKVAVTLDQPKDGAIPATKATVATEPANAATASVTWEVLPADGSSAQPVAMKQGEKFVAGKKYQAVVKFNVAAPYTLAAGAGKCTINGNAVSVNADLTASTTFVVQAAAKAPAPTAAPAAAPAPAKGLATQATITGVTVKPTEATLGKDDTLKLEVTVTGEGEGEVSQEVDFEYDQSVMSIDTGTRVLTAKDVTKGEPTTITVKSMADPTKTATCKITVLPKHNITITPDPAAGGTPSAEPNPAKAGDYVKLTANPAEGYELVQWNVKTPDVEIYNDEFRMPGSDVEIVATYKKTTPDTYTLTYDANGGKGTMAAQTAEAGKSVTLTANAFTRDGYTFTGWNTAKDGKGTSYKDKDSVTLSANTTLYAQWTENSKPAPATYTLTFDANEGTGTMGTLVAEAGKSVTLTPNTFTREGYAFTGWNTAKDGTGTPYADQASVTLNANTTLYAQWRAIVTPAPQVTTSAAGKFISQTTEVTFTVKQDVPWDATYMRLWFALDNAMRYTTSAGDVTVKTADGSTVAGAKVTIDGQILTVLVEDATALRDQTVVVQFKAKVKDNANLNPYANSAKTVASIPYQAFTEFKGAQDRTVASAIEHVKVTMPSSKSTASTKKNATPKTGDPLAMLVVVVAAGMAASGASLAYARRRNR